MENYQNHHNRIDVKTINDLILSSPKELVSMSENRYFEQLESVAESISNRASQSSILLVSGPSASTKTTTSHKLSEQLLANGLHSVVVSLDNFFVNVDKLPRLENGDTDFESVDTIDMDTLNRCFEELIVKRKSVIPIFDFANGRRSSETNEVILNDETIVIVEGIHALNPRLLQGKNRDSCLKLYISPSSDYYFNDEMILSSRNIRFTRRLVRDYFYRGTRLDTTVDMWVNVVKSELINIMPYKKEADYTIDSTILYEPAIYEYYLSKIMGSNELDGFYKGRIDDVFKALNRFYPLAPDIIPQNTVLHEFLA